MNNIIICLLPTLYISSLKVISSLSHLEDFHLFNFLLYPVLCLGHYLIYLWTFSIFLNVLWVHPIIPSVSFSNLNYILSFHPQMTAFNASHSTIGETPPLSLSDRSFFFFIPSLICFLIWCITYIINLQEEEQLLPRTLDHDQKDAWLLSYCLCFMQILLEHEKVIPSRVINVRMGEKSSVSVRALFLSLRLWFLSVLCRLTICGLNECVDGLRWIFKSPPITRMPLASAFMSSKWYHKICT